VPWFRVIELLTVRQLVAPGSKWHLHRRWFLSSAMDQLLDEDFAVATKNRLHECLDRLGQDAHALRLLGVAVVMAFMAVWASEWLMRRRRNGR